MEATVSVALVSPAVPAHADGVDQLVRVAFVDLYTGPVDYDHPCVDIAGKLVAYPDDAPPSPMVGAVVHTLGPRKATTGADGGFTIQNCAARDVGVANMEFDGDAEHPATHRSVATPIQRQETRITARYAQLPTVVRDTLTLTGKIERHTADGAWVPVANTRALAGADSWGNGFGINAAADGTFTARRRTAADPSFNLTYRPHQEEARFFQQSSTHLTPPQGTVVRFRTRFTDLLVTPKQVAKGDQATVTGRIVQDDFDWSDPLGPRARIQADYVPKQGSARHVTASTDPHGRFKARFPVEGTGCLYVRYRGDARHLPVERRVCLDARTKTRFSGFRAHPGKNFTVGVSGLLLQRTHGWHSLAHRKVTIYFQADGSSRWVKKTVLVSNGRGAFAKTFKGARSGTWRAVFATAPGYWGAQSPQVDL